MPSTRFKVSNDTSNYLSVCPSNISITVHLIDFTLGRCIAEDPRKCSVECKVILMSGSRDFQSVCISHAVMQEY